MNISQGVVVANGGYSTTSGATLGITVAGTVAGTGFGQLQASNGLTLAGTLAISTGSGFTPSTGSVYQVITCGSCTGTFSSVTGTAAGGGHTYSVTYLSTAVNLTSS